MSLSIRTTIMLSVFACTFLLQSSQADANPKNIILGDVNLDGAVNLLDVEPMIDLIATGTFQQEADTNQDGAVNLLDVEPFIQILAGNPPTPQIQDFQIEFLFGATQNDFNIESPAGAGFLYDGVAAEFQIQTPLDPCVFGPFTVHALTGGLGLPMETLQQELILDQGVSQVIQLPPFQAGEVTYLFLSTPEILDIPLMYLRTEAGPVAFIQSLDCLQWQDLALEGLNVNQNQLDFQLDPGIDGIILDPGQPLPGQQSDIPIAGFTGTSDPWIIQLVDKQGLPAAFQPIRLLVEDPTVIGLRRSGFPDELPLQELPIFTNEEGFATFRVEYLGEGQSGISLFSDVDLFPVPLPLPDPTGIEPVQFFGQGDTDPVIPTIKSVRVTKCITNPGQPDEMEVPINEGLTEDAPLLAFGVKYEIQADLTGKLPPGTQLVWCIEKFGNLVQVVEQDGRICITTPDPNAASGDKAHVGIDVKIVQDTPDGPQPVTTPEFLDFDIVEKKTITICPIHFGDAVPNQDRWDAIIAAMNRMYNGTGVCFEVADIQVGDTDEKEMCVCITALAGDPEKTSQRTLTGDLKDCVEADDTLEGDPDKITIHVGINFKLKRGTDTGDCQGGYNGSATGAVKVLCDAGVKADYDTAGDWANVIVLSPGLLNEVRGEQVVAHEVAHILGLPHVGDSEDDNMLHRFGEGNDPGSKRKLKPSQIAEIYKSACALLD